MMIIRTRLRSKVFSLGSLFKIKVSPSLRNRVLSGVWVGEVRWRFTS